MGPLGAGVTCMRKEDCWEVSNVMSSQNWYRTVSCLIAIVCVGLSLTVYASRAQASDIVLRNEYIAVTVNGRAENAGRFAIKTTGGDPDRLSDDNTYLIYQREDVKGPWTSFTTVSVDGTPWVYGGPTRDSAGFGGFSGVVVRQPALVENRRIESAWQMGPLRVSQSVSFVRSSTTGLMDTARICYELWNSDSQQHHVGMRVTLDTMLGDNDGAPFRVGEQAVTTDTVFSGRTIPEFWQAFDSLEDPKVTAQGTLWGGEVTQPDKVYFTNWGTLTEHPWEVDFQPGRDFTRIGGFELDSAMALVWEPTVMAAGERRTYVIYYGLGGITIAPGQLQLGVTCPATVIGGDTGDSFPVVAYVQNGGSGETRDLEATISLPKGLKLVPGQQATRSLPNLRVGETAQVSWRVQALEGAGKLTLSVGVTAMNAEPNTVSRQINVVSPARLRVTLKQPQARLSVVDNQWHPVPYAIEATVSNVGQAAASGVQAEWSSSRGLQMASGDTPTRTIGFLDPGESYAVRWHIAPTGEAGDLPFTLRASWPAQSSAVSASGLLRVPPLESGVGITVERLAGRGPGPLVVGETFVASVWAANLRAAHRVDVEVTYDPTRLRLLGGPLGVDRGTLFVTKHREYLGWDRPKVWVDISKPLARVVVSGHRADAPVEPILSGSVALLRFEAIAPGSSTLHVDKAVVKDRYDQELQVATGGAGVTTIP
jgi:hypothetical protein